MNYKELEKFCYEISSKMNEYRNQLIVEKHKLMSAYDEKGASLIQAQIDASDKTRKAMWEALEAHKGE